MSSTAALIVEQAAKLVRRTRAGDQNAMAIVYRIGEEARKGNKRASLAAKAVKQYIQQNPGEPGFTLGAEPPAVMDASPSTAIVVASPVAAIVSGGPDPESRKPVLPPGSLEGILDPSALAIVVMRVLPYQHGLAAAATVLASGPLLTADVIDGILGALTPTESNEDELDAAERMFHNGVRFCTPEDWRKVGRGLDEGGRKAFLVGQCVGRARRLQAVRMPRGRIGVLSKVAGWELGE
jgi:hypothetical protein